MQEEPGVNSGAGVASQAQIKRTEVLAEHPLSALGPVVGDLLRRSLHRLKASPSPRLWTELSTQVQVMLEGIDGMSLRS